MNAGQKIALKNAIMYDNYDYLKQLDAKNIDWQTECIDAGELYMPDCPVLHYALYCEKLDVLKLAFSVKPQLIDCVNDVGETLVVLASMCDYLEILNYLIDNKADLNKPSTQQNSNCNAYDQSPIAWATKFGNVSIVKRLVEAGVDYNKVIEKEKGTRLIHVACIHGHLDLVEYFVTLQPEIPDLDFNVLITLASHYRNLDVLSYLLKERTKAGKIDKKSLYPLFNEAFRVGIWDVASELLLHMLAGDHNSSYKLYAKTSGIIIELMLRDPSLNAVFAADVNIVSILKKDGYQIVDGKIELYRMGRERRHSFFAQINTRESKSDIYYPTAMLGSGYHGLVRKFETKDGNAIAVKSLLRDPESEIAANICQKEMEKDKQFNELLYPSQGNVRNYLFKKDENTYSPRQVMTYVKGKNFDNFAPTINLVEELAMCALKIAQELQRFHSLGVINGDLGPCNMMLYMKNAELFVQFIDLNNSYYLKDETAQLWNHLPLNEIKWYPPELANPSVNKVTPHVNQNVYSLAYVFQMVLGKHALKTKLYAQYPSIEQFITTGLSVDPSLRCNLEDFITELSFELTDLGKAITLGV